MSNPTITMQPPSDVIPLSLGNYSSMPSDYDIVNTYHTALFVTVLMLCSISSMLMMIDLVKKSLYVILNSYRKLTVFTSSKTKTVEPAAFVPKKKNIPLETTIILLVCAITYLNESYNVHHGPTNEQT